jgi:hypothetical protein
LPIINKTKHPTKGEKMEKTRGLKTRQTKKPSKKANSLGEWGQNKVLGTPTLREAYQIRRGEEHLK